MRAKLIQGSKTLEQSKIIISHYEHLTQSFNYKNQVKHSTSSGSEIKITNYPDWFNNNEDFIIKYNEEKNILSFKKPILSYVGLTYKKRPGSTVINFKVHQKIPEGTYLFDLEESNEDELIIYI
jgi:hypothetical protein